jgi:hypothetical protein
MPIELTRFNRKYRPYLPTGHYDLIIVSLVHQGPEMVYYMANNLSKYVKGKFLWVVHYNGQQYIDENTLPSWAWIVRDSIKTERATRLLMMGINQALKFAIANVTSINIMTLSSGSALFRDLIVPKEKIVKIISHEVNFDSPGKKYYHVEEIDIKYIGKCKEYLESLEWFGWQYKYGGDKDLEFHNMVQKRNFKYLRGGQWSGQVWPYEVGKILVEDISELENSELHKSNAYACEEIYMSTYAHNYAKENGIEIGFSEVIINWNSGYEVRSVEYINSLRTTYKYGSGVCKVSEDLSDPVRRYIN